MPAKKTRRRIPGPTSRTAARAAPRSSRSRRTPKAQNTTQTIDARPQESLERPTSLRWNF